MNENFINVSMYLAKNKKLANWGHLTKVNTYFCRFLERSRKSPVSMANLPPLNSMFLFFGVKSNGYNLVIQRKKTAARRERGQPPFTCIWQCFDICSALLGSITSHCLGKEPALLPQTHSWTHGP